MTHPVDMAFAFPPATIAGFLRQIADQRDADYPALVEAKRIDRDAADRARRIARALAKLWTAIAEAKDVETNDPANTFGASYGEMREEASKILDRLRAEAKRHPDDANRAELVAGAECLCDNLAPWSNDYPRPFIVALYETDRNCRRASRREAA